VHTFRLPSSEFLCIHLDCQVLKIHAVNIHAVNNYCLLSHQILFKLNACIIFKMLPEVLLIL